MASLLTRAAGSLAVRLVVTGAILAYLAAQIDMSAAAAAVVRVRGEYLSAVLALVALDRAVMILRWIRLLRASGVAIDGGRAATLFLISSFVGSFLPAGVGGDAARAYGLSRETASGSEALASVVVDRLLGILSLVLMGLAGLIAWTPPSGADWRGGVAVALTLAASVAAFWTGPLTRALVPARLQERGAFRRMVTLGDAVGRYRQRPGVLARVLGWSVVVQLLRIVQAYLLGLGLGIAVPFSYYLLVMPVGLLMLLLPISVSGFGLPQGVIVWLLRPVGVADEQSFALSTLIVLTGLAGNLPGLVLWLRDRDRRRPLA